MPVFSVGMVTARWQLPPSAGRKVASNDQPLTGKENGTESRSPASAYGGWAMPSKQMLP